MNPIRRKLSSLTDPVQRRWIMGRIRNRWPGPAPFTPHHPPYVTTLPQGEPVGETALGDCRQTAPGTPLVLSLPLDSLHLAPVDIAAQLQRSFADPATAMGLHAFQWMDGLADPAWGAALWQGWWHAFGEDGDRLAWSSEGTALRAVAWADFARRHGLPGPRQESLRQLSAHADAIAGNLAYRGEHGTGVALALQGHALFRLGLDLGRLATAALGLALLKAEAERLASPCGIIRGGSTQHHLLLARAYADSWLAARRQRHPAASWFEATTRRLLAVVPALALPGGLPLIGDVAASLPPGHLGGLVRGTPMDHGWTGHLGPEDRAALARLRDQAVLTDLEALGDDGWLRFDQGQWSGLWHAAPGGWTMRSGQGHSAHGHQDLGGFELHYGSEPIFVDVGGSTLGEANGGSFSASAAAHNTILLEGLGPYPEDRPEYCDAFRRAVAGGAPVLRSEHDGVSLSFDGFSRLAGPRHAERRWSFAGDALVIDDFINGTGRYRVSRMLLTPLAVSVVEDGVILEGAGRRWKLTADQPVAVEAAELWPGWGLARPLQRVSMDGLVNLPWRGRISIEPA